MNDEDRPAGQPSGYGKRPIWQWVVIYLVVAAIVYAIIYFLFIKGDNGY